MNNGSTPSPANAIIFAARRLRHDRVAFILTRRFDEAGPHDLTGFATYPLTGLTQQDVADLLGVGYSTAVVNVLPARPEEIRSQCWSRRGH